MADESTNQLLSQILSQMTAIQKKADEIEAENKKLREELSQARSAPVVSNVPLQTLSALKEIQETPQKLSNGLNDEITKTAQLLVRYAKIVNFH